MKAVLGVQSSTEVSVALASSLLSEPFAKALGWVDSENHPFNYGIYFFLLRFIWNLERESASIH